jgi:diguanylate cyclase (GGDEF)-like protein/putative nucleotidyltransferase with HDIG domain
MQVWQKERKEKLMELVLVTHIITYLITIGVLVMYESNPFTFKNALIGLSLVTPATIFIILDYFFLQRDNGKHTQLYWNIIKHTGLFAIITLVFSRHQGKYLDIMGVLFLLPVVLACITLGRKWGLVFAGISASAILALNITFNSYMSNQHFEVLLALSGIFFLVAWFLGGIIDIENRTTIQLSKMANQDELTGLANHRYFQEMLTWSVEEAQRLNYHLSLIFIDIDFFKRYNDAYGHTQGDLLLHDIGRLLEKSVPSSAFIARYGGEEFAVILPKAKINEANTLANKLREAVINHKFNGDISQPYQKVTVSAGVANLPYHAKNKQELLEAADEALYSSKFTGRNRVRTYLAVLDRLSQTVGESDKDLVNSLKTLMTVINAKDRYTYGHSERVVHYAKLVGQRLGMAEENLRLLEYGAFLHDVGKIEIPRELLNKNGSLTQEEWNIMRQHPSWGAEILKPSQVLLPVIPMVLHHHENYDGSGYPNGLKGNEIPLFAGILRVVDSFDAITTYRPYRVPLTLDEAFKDISRNSGWYYDPEVVDAFLDVMKLSGKDKIYMQ